MHLDGGYVEDAFALSPLGGKRTTAEVFAPTLVRGTSAQDPVGGSIAYGKWLREAASLGQAARIVRQVRETRTQQLIEVAFAIPEVSDYWAEQSNWTLAVKGRWRYPEEHINVKEARIALDGVRRSPRSQYTRGRRCLNLIDNMVACLAFDKGRSRSWALNAVCRRLCG